MGMLENAVGKLVSPLTIHGLAMAVGPALSKDVSQGHGNFNLTIISRLRMIDFPTFKIPVASSSSVSFSLDADWSMERFAMDESFADYFFGILKSLGIEPGNKFGLYPHVYVETVVARGYYLENCKVSNVSMFGDIASSPAYDGRGNTKVSALANEILGNIHLTPSEDTALIEVMRGTCERVVPFNHEKL